MVGWELPPFNSGGLGEACYGLAKALSKKGVNINFVLPYKMNVKADFMNVIFADTKETDILKSLQSTYTTYPEWKKLFGSKGSKFSQKEFLAKVFEYARNIKSIAQKTNSDIIHMHDWLTYPAGIVAKSIMKKPVVAHIHSTEFDRTGGNNPNMYVYEVEKYGFDNADVIVPVGGFMKNTLQEKYGVDPNKVHVVYNGVDDASMPNVSQSLTELKKLGYKLVLFLGRITLQKGPDYFVRASKIVSDYYPKATFVVTGSGDMQGYMMSEAARLGVIDKYIFTGFIRGDEKNQIYQAADVFVMPSVSEPFGITALESVKNRTPVIISKQSGVSEVLKNSLKVDYWDVEELANKIIAVLKYDSLPKDLRNESVKELMNLTWDKSADDMVGIYQQLIR